MLSDFGVIKVHWEAYSECNLECPFCYRSKSVPLDTLDARRLLEKVSMEGVKQVVFTGGDPLIRQDLVELLELSHALGIKTEVHTNAQRQRRDIDQLLADVDLLGLSIDGPTADLHDLIRRKNGNFDRVIGLLNRAESIGTPYIVRTVVTKENIQFFDRIGKLLLGKRAIVRWSIGQFTAVGDGFINGNTYRVSDEDFEAAATAAKEKYSKDISIDIYPNILKMGTYLQIRSDGQIYTTVKADDEEHYPTLGSIFDLNLDSLMRRLQFRLDLHHRRYG